MKQDIKEIKIRVELVKDCYSHAKIESSENRVLCMKKWMMEAGGMKSWLSTNPFKE